jgi:hypothetical protein
MGEDEYPTSRDAAIRGYAEDKQRSGDWVSRDGLTLSAQAFHCFAPSGLQTPDQHFFTIHDAATDAKVGWLWYQVRNDGLYRSAFLCDIVIFEEYQRQGVRDRLPGRVGQPSEGPGNPARWPARLWPQHGGGGAVLAVRVQDHGLRHGERPAVAGRVEPSATPDRGGM